MPLGVGNIDWKEAVSALKSIGYDETITLEVFFKDRSVSLEPLEENRRLVLDLWDRQRR
jgi:sugar phosphate isomerase/epimerase